MYAFIYLFSDNSGSERRSREGNSRSLEVFSKQCPSHAVANQGELSGMQWIRDCYPEFIAYRSIHPVYNLINMIHNYAYIFM